MKIFVIHGDDSVKSLERLNRFLSEARKRKWEIEYVDDNNFTLAEKAGSTSLFSTERFFIHRNFKNLNALDFNWIKKRSPGIVGHLVLYSNQKITKTLLSKLPPDSKIEEYTLPVLIWKFLDSFYPGNSNQILRLYHELLSKEPSELIVYFLSNHLKDLYWASEDPGSMPYPAWKQGKLKKQASLFGKSDLKSVINELADIDIKSKTSQTELKELLDFLIINNLQ